MTENKKVLIIDDDNLTSSLISEILSSAGYESSTCSSCKEYDDEEIFGKYDIFIVDLLLDDTDGLKIIKHLRAIKPDSIIITITGLDAAEHLKNSMQAGADHFFNKPVNASKLLDKIEELNSRIIKSNGNFKFTEIVSKAFDCAANPVFITDNKGNLYYANQHFLKLSGLSKSRIRRYNIYSLRFESALEFDQLIKKHSYHRLENRIIESRFLVEKNREVWFNVIINPITQEKKSIPDYFLFQLFDITRKKQMDNFILSNEEKFRSFISLSNDGMALINEKGLVIEWNNSMTEISGVSIEKVYGERIWDILQWINIEFDDDRLTRNLKSNIKYVLRYGINSEKNLKNVCRINHQDGHIVHIQYSVFTIRVDNGFRLGIVVRDNTSTVISQRKIAAQNEELSRAYVKMEKLARIDPLTQISNRRDIKIRLDYEKRRVSRQHHQLSIAIGDIDDFKHFNDTYGHDMGDFVLQELARITNKTIREQDFIGRWGGEEFIFVFPETPLEGGRIICERLRQIIQDHQFKFKGKSLAVTMTIGLSEYIEKEPVNAVIKRADVALYEGKKSGKNRVIAG